MEIQSKTIGTNFVSMKETDLYVKIAKIFHGARKMYCEALEINNQLSWETLTNSQKTFIINRVKFAMNNDDWGKPIVSIDEKPIPEMRSKVQFQIDELFKIIIEAFYDDPIHILPINDIKEHIESEDCPCNPEIEFCNGAKIIKHNAYDGRD